MLGFESRDPTITSKSKLLCTVFACYLWLSIPANLSASNFGQNVTHHRIGERQSQPTCIKPQFTCGSPSRECIEASQLCNGVKDCKDGSDETVSACRQVKCPQNFFKCNYGACIQATLKCNGRQDCVDNSDEANSTCPAPSPISQDLILFRKCKQNEWRCRVSGICIRKELKCDGKMDCVDGTDEDTQTCQPERKDGARSVTIPSQSLLRHQQSSTKPITSAPTSTPVKNVACDLPRGAEFTVVLTDRSDDWLNTSLLTKAPKFSKIQIFCNPDYALPNGEKLQRSVCQQKETWNPPLRTCLKTCPNLQSENMILSCHREGVEIDCESDLVNGTTIRPRCRPLYHIENEAHRELRCLEDGQWDAVLSECVPDCGITNNLLQETQNLIIDGKPANASDSPWHVAIYRFSGMSKSPILICGGTLISANIVVSAAHCFFDLGRGVTLNYIADYEVMVSKYTRNYTIVDNSFQKKYKIRDIIFTDAGYNPTLTGQFSNDIVALVLKRKVDMSKFVLPACVDWISSGVNRSQLAEGTPGKLVGWGVDKEKDVGSPELLYAELPYISFQKCVGKLKQIDTDKFCAGDKTGAGARKGDSGGGLIFRNSDSGRHYLRGIVSTTDKDGQTSIATFTDVSKYVDWLDRVRARVTKESRSAATDSTGVCNVTYGPGQKVELFDQNDNWLNIPSGVKAPKLSTIEITCNPQYTLENGNRFQRSTCFLKEKWSPPLKPCLRTCPNLYPANMDLTCYFQGARIDCNGELVSGTRVQPSCKTFYHSEKKVDYRELRCRDNGEWDNSIFECVPDCGILPPVSEQRSTRPTSVSLSPWNVAIYKRQAGSLPTLQCSGTLISRNMIVSAANCFYDHDQGVALNSPQDYEIVVGKITKDYSTADNDFQKKYEISDIMFPNYEEYDPHSMVHSSNNIVVLVTKQPVQMNKFVLPACTDWTNTRYVPEIGSSGQLVGWAWGPNNKMQNLQRKTYSSVDQKVCSEIVLDLDKICMETATTFKTYSGEGLLVHDPDTGRYFLRGVSGRVTAQLDFPQNMTAFTDLSRHIEWLKGIHYGVNEDEIIPKGCLIPDDGFQVEEILFIQNKEISLSDDSDNPLNISSGSKAPKFSKMKITCLDGYSLPNGQKIQQSVCVHKEEWNPPLKPCSQICPPLKAANTNLSCYRNDAKVDCNGEMIYNTRVQPRCEQHFKRERHGVIYREMSCRKDGNWDHELHDCVPDCGWLKTKPEQTPSKTTWLTASVRDYPWNVAIYRKDHLGNPIFLCSGTLVSANMIVSVAHWFYNSKKGVFENSTADYEAYVGKYTTIFDHNDNEFQMVYKIREFIFTDVKYNPTASRLNDIVVLMLKTPVEMNEFVFPACIDWNSKTNGFRLNEGAPGNLVSWLRTSNESAQMLHHTQLQFISFGQCSKKLGYIDPDRFCAGSDNGSTVESGIGGGGLVFRDPNTERYFLRGVWSGRSSKNNVNVGTFTDISKHIDWLGRVRDKVGKESTAEQQQTSNIVIVEAKGWVIDIK